MKKIMVVLIVFLSLLISQPVLAGTAYTNVIETPPSPLSSDFQSWMQRLIDKRVAYSDTPRAANYYFSYSTGNDSNPCTIKAPCKSISKINQFLQVPDVAIHLKAGDEWATSTGIVTHNNKQTIQSYSVGEKPFLNRFNIKYNIPGTTTPLKSPRFVGWKNWSGDVWRRAETNTIGWVREQNNRIDNPYLRIMATTSLATNPRSFSYDSTYQFLYINCGVSCNPNTVPLEAVPNNSDHGIEVFGDAITVKGIRADGWGLNMTPGVTTQAQPFTSRAAGTDEQLFMDNEAYFSDAHVIAMYGGVVPGGIATFIRNKGGYPTYSGSMENIYNCFSTFGRAECIYVENEVVHGSAPSDDWYTATNNSRGEDFYGHTATGENALSLYVGNITRANPYGTTLHEWSVAGTVDSTVSGVRTWLFNNIVENNAGSDLRIARTGSFQSGERYFAKPLNNGYLGAVQGIGDGWFVNGYVQLDTSLQTDYPQNSIYGFVNSLGGSYTPKLWNNHFRVINAAANTNNFFDYRVYAGDNGLSGASLMNNIFDTATTSLSNNYVGIQNTASSTNNAYWNMAQANNQPMGYNNHSNKVMLTSAPEAFATPAPSSPLYHAGDCSNGLQYDAFFRARSSACSIGPVEAMP